MALIIRPGSSGKSVIQIGKSKQVGNTGEQTGVPSLKDALSAINDRVDARKNFLKKPVLIYIIVDLTASREDTRTSMRRYEEDLAVKIRSVGGKHPVICKGVYHRGGASSEPIILSSERAIQDFLNEKPIGGATDIETGLKNYLNDPTDAIVSLGILIGDSNDGDPFDNLQQIAQKLGQKKRPLIVAHERTNDNEFCDTVAPVLARKSEGLSFQLSKNPEELNILLDNLRKVLEMPPELLAQNASKPFHGLQLRGTSSTKEFIDNISKTLLLSGPK